MVWITIFINHIQGLYPESHGIVNNAFYDTKLREQFYIGSRNQNDPKWWRGEPVSIFSNKDDASIAAIFSNSAAQHTCAELDT